MDLAQAIAAWTLTALALAAVTAIVARRWRHASQPPDEVAELRRRCAALEAEIARQSATEQSLQHSVEKYRALVEHANDVVLIAQDGVMKFANPRTESVLGYRHEELVSMPFTDLIVPEDRAMVLDRYLRRLQGEDVPSRYKFRILARGGEPSWVEINTLVVQWEGRPGSLCFLRDVNDQVRAEEQIREAQAAAEEANRAKSRFLANMSHELRTPMNGVIGLTELTLSTPLAAEQRSYLDGVLESAEFMLSLINSILDFSKIEADKITLSAAEFRLRGELSDTIKIVALRAAEKGLELACDVRPDVPDYLMGDAARLRQVLFNLVGNAIKFTEQGEVSLTVERDASVAAAAGSVALRFTVRDTGIGIPAEKQRLIFEAFQQADDSITRQYGGTGLGLAIGRQLVELMGGKLTVESQPARGSQFAFTVPFTLARAAEEDDSHPEVRGLRALVVDGHPATRQAIVDMLLAWRIDATGVDFASEAGDKTFDLVIADSRAADIPSAAPLVVVVARPRPGETRHEAAPAGAVLVTRPVTPSDLLEAVLRARAGSVAGHSAAPSPNTVAMAATPLRVLLVEDNAINQRVAISWLEKRGHRVALATGGQQAIDMLAGAPFDAVLMDLEMPGMGGVEATARIRAAEADGGGRIPIIAMTAHALPGDRERCLAAGMDDYLSKPVRPAELFATVERCGAPDAENRAAPRQAAGARQHAADCLFDRDAALESVGGDAALLSEIIDIFLADCPRWLRDLEAAIGEDRGDEARRLAHSLKNSAGYFGASAIRQQAFALEEAARDGRLVEAREMLAALHVDLERLLPELAACRDDLACRE
jgi:PAS domain S-box-containing protein